MLLLWLPAGVKLGFVEGWGGSGGVGGALSNKAGLVCLHCVDSATVSELLWSKQDKQQQQSPSYTGRYANPLLLACCG